MKITHVIISLRDVLHRADHAVRSIQHGEGLTSRKLIEYVLQTAQEDDDLFGIEFWHYVESILTPEQIEAINERFVSEIFDWTFGELYEEIGKQLGLGDPGVLRFVRWLNQTDVLLEIMERQSDLGRNDLCRSRYPYPKMRSFR